MSEEQKPTDVTNGGGALKGCLGMSIIAIISMAGAAVLGYAALWVMRQF